ncbi:MAG TPA: hypothetical protein VFE06_06320 [Acidobacteriaceae bacterium]|jgi:hypothetical protein|nr:hypothetical protein [Acidobacteriaceae bacterium]
MTTTVAVFIASFAVVGIAMMAIAWTMSIHAELKVRNSRQRRHSIDESHAAWKHNREMIVY